MQKNDYLLVPFNIVCLSSLTCTKLSPFPDLSNAAAISMSDGVEVLFIKLAPSWEQGDA